MGIENLGIEELGKTRRKTLGDEVPVLLFRLLRLIAMHRLLGESAGHTLYMMGKDLGKGLPADSVEGLLDLLKALKVGIGSVTESSDERVVIFVDECITCSGLPDIGEIFCHLEGGIIAGALENILGRPARAVQTKSNSAGFRGCQFEVSLF